MQKKRKRCRRPAKFTVQGPEDLKKLQNMVFKLYS